MELHLKNFKCYYDHTIKLPDSPFVLIRGQNGVGKTTIFKAIVYALFGKQKKPFSHGTTTCKVVLKTTFSDTPIQITRRSHPNVVSIKMNDQEYQNEEAQAKIEELLGMDHDQFLMACCVRKRDMSVLDMTPTQRLRFIESLSRVKDQGYKKELKKRIKDLTLKLKTIEREVDVRRETYKTFKSQIGPKVKKPSVPKEDAEDQIEDATDQLKSKRKGLLGLQEETSRLRDLKDKYHETQTKRLAMESQIKDLETQLNEPLEDPDGVQNRIKKMDRSRRIKELEEFITTTKIVSVGDVLSEDEITDLKKIIDDYEDEQDEIDSYNRRLERLRQDHERLGKTLNLPDLGDSLSELRTFINHQKDTLNTLLDTKKQIQKKIRDVDALGIAMKCPSCDSTLCVSDDHLIVYKKPKHTSDKLQTKLQKTNESIRKIQKVVDCYDSNRDLLSKFESWTNTMPTRIITKEKYNSAKDKLAVHKSNVTRHKEMKESMDKLKSYKDEIKKLSELGIEPYDKETYTDLTRQLHHLKGQWSLRERNTIELRRLKMNLRDLAAVDPPEDPAKHKNRIAELVSHIDTLNDTIHRMTDVLDHHKKYKSFKDRVRMYTDEKTKYETAKEEMNSVSFQLTGHIGVLDACNEADILLNQSLVDMINTAAAGHLERLFDDPIIVSIDGYKKNASDGSYKPSMTITGEWKNNEIADHDEDLSSGEIQKCVLAFRLAVGDVLGRQVLFMDESLNELDNVNYNQVMEYLAEYSRESGVNVYIISHHPYTGMFDRICDF